jgi:hypothetical protein
VYVSFSPGLQPHFYVVHGGRGGGGVVIVGSSGTIGTSIGIIGSILSGEEGGVVISGCGCVVSPVGSRVIVVGSDSLV